MMLHILRDCKVAKDFWNNFLINDKKASFFSGNLIDWIGEDLQGEGKWPTTFSSGVWWLWKWRNGRIVGAADEIVEPNHEFVIGRVREYLDLCGTQRRLNKGVQAPTNWERPKEGWWKLNSDESFLKGSSLVRAGGLLRDHEGIFLKA